MGLGARSPFADPAAGPLDPAKFRHPQVTAKGERRAHIGLRRLETLWLNTGTLCNLECKSCYIESSPRNDSLVYLSLAEAEPFLDEALSMGAVEIGFTGGEPFMNPDMIAMMRASLGRGLRVLVLTNAMRPMRRFEAELAELAAEFGQRITMRVSVDHYTRTFHEAERGARSWDRTIDGLRWLAEREFRLAVAGRAMPGESEAQARSGYDRLFEKLGIAADGGLVIFPQMDATLDVPEITEDCWQKLGVSPEGVMCSFSRMVVKRKGADAPEVVACTLLPYDERFAMGATLQEARRDVPLNHPHCARFCVLGGATCSG